MPRNDSMKLHWKSKVSCSYSSDQSHPVSVVCDSIVCDLVAAGAQGFCPAPLLKKVEEWDLEDPKGKSIEKVRRIRDEIEVKVKNLISEVA